LALTGNKSEGETRIEIIRQEAGHGIKDYPLTARLTSLPGT